MKAFTTLSVLASILALAGCNTETSRNNSDPLPQIGASSSDLRPFVAPKGGFITKYPATWSYIPGDSLLNLEFNLTDLGQQAELDLIVPDVPAIARLTGQLTMDRVVNGYTDDLKKRFDNLKILADVDQPLLDSTAKRIRATGTHSHEDRFIEAVVALHHDQVYIVETRTNQAAIGAADQVLEVILSNWKWTNK